MPLPVARPLSKYTRNGRCRKARDASPKSESVNQFCIGHLRERVRAPDPDAPRGAVVGDAASVSDRQRRRCGFQADGVAVAQANWRARRAAPSARALNASRANTWGGGRAPRRAAAVRRQERHPVAGLACVVTHHRHPFESQPRYCRTRAPRQSTSFLRRWRRCGSGGAAALAAPDRHGSPPSFPTADPPDAEVSRSVQSAGRCPAYGVQSPAALRRPRGEAPRSPAGSRGARGPLPSAIGTLAYPMVTTAARSGRSPARQADGVAVVQHRHRSAVLDESGVVAG